VSAFVLRHSRASGALYERDTCTLPTQLLPLQALAASSMPRYRGGALKGTASTMTELRLLYDFD
jgi:hypothetical protein